MKFLVPTNFSKIAEEALSASIGFTKKIDNASIILLHFIKSHTNNIADVEKDQSNVDSKVWEMCTQYLKKVRVENLGIPISLSVITYISEVDLFKQIEGLKSDLVVMGTQEVERYENEKLIGEHTRKFIRNVATPILCIREKLQSLDFKKVVLASNLKQTQIVDFNKLQTFFEEQNVPVEIILVVTPEKFITTQNALKAFEASSKMIKYNNISFKIYNEIGIAEGIIGYCSHNKVDLLVLPTQGRKGLDYFFNGSIAEVVLDELRIPTISILE